MKEAGLSVFDRTLGGIAGPGERGPVRFRNFDGNDGVHPNLEGAGGITVGAVFPGGRARCNLGGSGAVAGHGSFRDWIICATPSSLQLRPCLRLTPAVALAPSVTISYVLRARERPRVKDQLEALILQMYKSNILYSEAVREFKKRFILTVLEENKGNQCRAARELGMHRNTLSRTLRELKIDVRQLREGTRRPPRSARPAGPRKEKWLASRGRSESPSREISVSRCVSGISRKPASSSRAMIAPTGDLPALIDAACHLQLPARIHGKQIVEIAKSRFSSHRKRLALIRI